MVSFTYFFTLNFPLPHPSRGRNMASKIINFYDTVLQTKPKRLV